MHKKFNKDAKNHKELIELWRSKNLLIQDESVAYNALIRIGYYRLSGYCLPFYNASKSAFKDNVKLEDVLNLYEFDTELRSLISQALEKLEVAIRCSICEFMSRTYKSHWYTNPSAYISGHQALLEEAASKVDFDLKNKRPYYQDPADSIKKGRQLFIDHYYSEYNDPLMPPSWMLREVTTFGYWARTFDALRHGDQKQICQKWLHLDGQRINPALLTSWLWSISILRNRCAHHTRITYQRFSFPPKLPDKNPSNEIFYSKTDDLHTLLVIILVLLNSSFPTYSFRSRLLEIFNSYPSIDIEKATGFSKEGKSNWDETIFWSFPV